MSEVSREDLLAEAVLDCAAAFILMANAQLELENAASEREDSSLLSVMYHHKLNEATQSWYQANKLVISCIQSIPEASDALAKYIRKRRLHGESRESTDVPVSSSRSDSTQEISGLGNGEVWDDIRNSLNVPFINDGLPGRAPETDGELSPTITSSGQSFEGNPERTSRVAFTKKYLSNNTILRASLLCSVNKDSFMSPLSLASDLPLVVYKSPEAYEGEIVYRDEEDRVFILEEVTNETI